MAKVWPGAISSPPMACTPWSLTVRPPRKARADYLGNPSIRLLADFFQTKGLGRLKQEDCAEVWYQDWIDFQAHHGLYARLLSPKQYSTRGTQFDLRN